MVVAKGNKKLASELGRVVECIQRVTDDVVINYSVGDRSGSDKAYSMMK